MAKKGNFRENEVNYKIASRRNLTSLPLNHTPSIATKNELSFFDNLKQNLGEPQYVNLIKLMYLYAECIITLTEFFSMAGAIISDPQTLAILKESLYCREASRRKMTQYFKPLGDLDFSSKKARKCVKRKESEKPTPSYSKLADDFLEMKKYSEFASKD